MSNYWVKIGVGALCVFGVGMTGISLARKGVHEAKAAALGPVREALNRLPTDLLNFRLDGRRIGKIRQIDLSNEGEWAANSIQMLVALDREADGLADCLLTNERWGSHNRDARFRCVEESEIGEENLVQVGEVRFEPGSLTRPLYASRRDLRRIDRSDIRGLKATVSSADGKSITGQAKYDIRDHNGTEQKGTVRVDASDGRALIEIRDDNGREVFRLRADDHGVSINAKDKRGRALMRLFGGESGIEIKVDAEKNTETP
jgi:hypothetical protein